MRKVGLNNDALLLAVEEMKAGLIDANLGGGVMKKRIALPGRGKSGGARTLVATFKGGHWFFLYGFNKNEKDNISQDELELLKELAKDFLGFNTEQISIAVHKGEIEEVTNGST